MSECGDAEKTWYPQRRVCYAAMTKAYAKAKYDELHDKRPFHNGTFTEWGEKRTGKTPYHYLEGVHIWIADSDLTPHDHFLGGSKDCVECSGRSVVDQEQDDGGDQ